MTIVLESRIELSVSDRTGLSTHVGDDRAASVPSTRYGSALPGGG
ncbi:hypothetical protein [Tessaracoccus sp. G1721]